MDHCGCHANSRAAPVIPPPGKNLRRAVIVFIGVVALSFLEPFTALNESLLEYLSLVWWAVLLGLLLGGVIDYFVPDGLIIRHLGQRNKRSLLFAVLAGFAMSACSHGMLAIAIQLYKKGASVACVVTFLLASPWANLPMTILMFSFFGWHAILFLIGAMSIALISGLIFQFLDRAGWIEPSNPAASAEDVTWDRLKNIQVEDAARGILSGSMSLANMVLWWILVGILVAALIGAYVPDHWFMQYLGPDFSGLLLTLLLATIIEVCSEGSSPIAFEIFNKVGALGNPFVFLMAGVATDYTEIGLLWTNIGRRTAIWLPVVTVPQILLIAYLFNRFLLV